MEKHKPCFPEILNDLQEKSDQKLNMEEHLLISGQSIHLHRNFIVNIVDNNRSKDLEAVGYWYRIKQRKKNSCASGSCSSYDNVLTLRENFPTDNDIRHGRSHYNLKSGPPEKADSHLDVLYESESYPNVSNKVTRHNSLSELKSKNELIPVIDSRETRAESNFIQSRLKLNNLYDSIFRKKNLINNRIDYIVKDKKHNRNSNASLDESPQGKRRSVLKDNQTRNESIKLLEDKKYPLYLDKSLDESQEKRNGVMKGNPSKRKRFGLLEDKKYQPYLDESQVESPKGKRYNVMKDYPTKRERIRRLEDKKYQPNLDERLDESPQGKRNSGMKESPSKRGRIRLLEDRKYHRNRSYSDLSLVESPQGKRNSLKENPNRRERPSDRKYQHKRSYSDESLDESPHGKRRSVLKKTNRREREPLEDRKYTRSYSDESMERSQRRGKIGLKEKRSQERDKDINKYQRKRSYSDERTQGKRRKERDGLDDRKQERKRFYSDDSLEVRSQDKEKIRPKEKPTRKEWIGPLDNEKYRPKRSFSDENLDERSGKEKSPRREPDDRSPGKGKIGLKGKTTRKERVPLWDNKKNRHKRSYSDESLDERSHGKGQGLKGKTTRKDWVALWDNRKNLHKRSYSDESLDERSQEKGNLPKKEWVGPLDPTPSKIMKKYNKISKRRSSPKDVINPELPMHTGSGKRLRKYSISTYPPLDDNDENTSERQLAIETPKKRTKENETERRGRSKQIRRKSKSRSKSTSRKNSPASRMKEARSIPTKGTKKSSTPNQQRNRSEPSTPNQGRNKSESSTPTDELPSHRRDTIVSKLRHKTKISRIGTVAEQISQSKKSQEKEAFDVAPDTKSRKSTYFNSDSGIYQFSKGKMRKLDVSSDCKIVCNDKEEKNYGKRYERYAIEPERPNKYLENPKPKLNVRDKIDRHDIHPDYRERVSFKEALSVPKTKRFTTKRLPKIPVDRPRTKHRSEKEAPPEDCEHSSPEECVNDKIHSQESLCPIDRKCQEPESENKRSPLYLGKPVPPSPELRTESETNTRQFSHKTALINYPDGAEEHLRDYHKEFTKEPFRSTQFSSMERTSSFRKPTIYPRNKSKSYNYSGHLDPDKKPNEGRALTSTMYVEREGRRDLGYQSKIGEKFFNQMNYKYSDNNPEPNVSDEGLTKSEEKREEDNIGSYGTLNPQDDKQNSINNSVVLKVESSLQKNNELGSRPISFSSYWGNEEGEEDNMKEPDNEVIATLLDSGKQSETDKLKNVRGKEYEIVSRADSPELSAKDIITDKKFFNHEHIDSTFEDIPNSFDANSHKKVENTEQDFSTNKNHLTQPSIPQQEPKRRPEKINTNEEDDNYYTAEEGEYEDSFKARQQSKLQTDDYGTLDENLLTEIEVGSDEKLLPNMIGHSAMHNWDQAEKYFYSDRRYRMNYEPRIVKRQKARERAKKAKLLREFEEEKMGESTMSIDTEENQDETIMVPVKEKPTQENPVPSKRFQGGRINPHSRFDAGYEFLQRADSDLSVEMEPETNGPKFETGKPEKRDSTMKKLAKMLFSSRKKNEEKEDDSVSNESSQGSSEKMEKKSSLRKVSFSVPLNM